MSQSWVELKDTLAVLLPYRKKISCTKCGICCGSCPALDHDNLCKVHPKRIGNVASRDLRGWVCNDTPVELALRHPTHVACPEVTQLLASLGYAVETSIDPETHIPYYVQVIKN